MKFKRVISALLMIVLLLSCVSACSLVKKAESTEPVTETTTEEPTEPTTEPTTATTDNPNYNQLTGLSMMTPGTKGTRPMAIVVSNAFKARPQWGVSSADICVEGVVEGGITRMLCLFSDSTVIPKIGPVRSARHDFAEIAQGFDGVFVHAGRSIYAAQHFAKWGMDDIEGCTYDGTYFPRDSERRPRGLEHSMYTDAELLAECRNYEGTRSAIDTNYVNVLTFATLGNPTTPASGVCKKVFYSYSEDFENTMVYNELTYRYTRYQNDELMTDANNDQPVSYVNVLLLFTEVSSMGDSAGCKDMDLSGGYGYYISKGKFENITWTKGEATNPLAFYRADGTVLPLNQGNSYIGLVPLSRVDMVEITGDPAPETTTAQ